MCKALLGYSSIIESHAPVVDLVIIIVYETNFNSTFPFEGWTYPVSDIKFLVWIPDFKTDMY